MASAIATVIKTYAPDDQYSIVQARDAEHGVDLRSYLCSPHL
jgi:hypothetical protein